MSWKRETEREKEKEVVNTNGRYTLVLLSRVSTMLLRSRAHVAVRKREATSEHLRHTLTLVWISGHKHASHEIHLNGQ